MLIHNVYFWLKDEIDTTARAAFSEGLRVLTTDPNVKNAYFGPPGDTPVREVIDNSYDYGLVLIFEDVEGHNRYQVGEIHDKFLADHASLFKTVQVFDIGM